MQACPFELRLISSPDASSPQVEAVATRIVAQVRRAVRDNPAVRHITVLPGRSPDSIQGVAFVVGEEDDTWRTVVRILDGLLDEVPDARAMFRRVSPPAPVGGDESPAMAASGQFSGLDRWAAL
ncbi:MAG: hypothetical protein V9G19_19045 [Tetrasphaera sp.]